MLLQNYEKKRKIKDFWAIILFVISVSSAVLLGMQSPNDGLILDFFEITKWSYFDFFSMFTAYVMIYLCFIGMFYMFTVPLMHIAPFLNAALLLGLAVYFNNLNTFLGSLFSAGALIFIYFRFMRKNIKYSAPIAKLTMKIIFQQALIVFPTILLLFGLICFLLVKFTFSYKIDGMIGYFLIFNMYWTLGLLMYFVYTLISSIVCFNAKSKSGIYGLALINTLYAIGSLAMASLIVAIIRTLRYIVNSRDNGDRRSSQFISFLLGCLNKLIEYFNEWAFVYISICGLGYVSACKKAFKELYKNPITTVLNNYCMSIALSCINLCVFTFFISLDYDNISKILGIMCGVFFTSYIVMALDSANKTLIALYSEDKPTFSQVYEFEAKVFDEQMAYNK